MILAIKIPFFLFLPKIRSVRSVADFFPSTQLVDLSVDKGFFICRLSQMRKRGSVLDAVDLRVKFIHLLPFLMGN
jgi:hypothetical protein